MVDTHCPELVVCDGTTAWNLTDKPYQVTSEVAVCPTGTLQIGSGVTARFAPEDGLYMTVEGGLEVNLAEGAAVELRSDRATPQSRDWGGVNVVGSGTADIRETAIRGGYYNLLVQGSSAVDLSGVTLENGYYGVYLDGSPALTLAGVTSRLNEYGLYVSTTDPATIIGSGSSFIENNLYGVHVAANGGAGPSLTLDGCALHSNVGAFDFYTYYFADAARKNLQVRDSWWGTTDPAQIVLRVYDQVDSVSSPTVDWCRYLDGPGGSPVVDAHCPQLAVCDGSPVAWNLTDKPYQVTSEVSVCSGAGNTLQIGPGVTARFVPSDRLNVTVEGSLEVNLAEGASTTLRSDRAVPQKSDWGGITVQDSGAADIREALIEHGRYNVHAKDAATAALIAVTLEEGDTGVYIEGSPSVTLNGVTARYNDHGLYAATTLPATVTSDGSSFVQNNSYGVYVYGIGATGPAVNLDHSAIHSNGGGFDYYAYYFANPTERTLSARETWWGTTDPHQIATRVYDRVDNAINPAVDWCRYLDGPGGSPVVDAHCPELSVCGGTTVWNLTDKPYQVTSEVIVCPTGTLQITPDVTARFVPQDTLNLLVQGRLEVNTVEGDPVELRSDRATPQKSDWGGVAIESSGTADIRESLINHGRYNVLADDTAAVDLVARTLEAGDAGVYVAGSPTVAMTDVTAQLNDYGLYVYTASAASVTGDGSRFVDNNQYGVYVYGLGGDGPSVTLDHSEIHSNLGSYDYYSYYFADAIEKVLQVRETWWGTTDPAQIVNRVYDQVDSAINPMVDWCRYLDGPGGVPVVDAHCPDLAVCSGTFSVSLTDKPYQVTSEWVVCPSGTLEIDPGVELRMVPSRYLNLRTEGRLEVNLTGGDPVAFRSDAAVPASDDWGGVSVVSNGDAEIREARIEHADNGVAVDDTSTTGIHDVTLENNRQGVYVAGEPYLTMSGVAARLNDYGLYVYTGSPATIRGSGCRFVDNNVYGIYVYGLGSTGPSFSIAGSAIHSNLGQYDVYTYHFADAANRVLWAPDNWWGTTDVDAIHQRIYEHSDSSICPHLRIDPFGSDCIPIIGRDLDRDSVGDFEDNCPSMMNGSQADSDLDGMGDACDPASGTPPTGACDGVDDATDGYVDSDGDGWGDPCDHQPTRADSYPGATELCDGRDQDGDGQFYTGEMGDGDFDLAITCADCNDSEPAIFPCACELCLNSIDDDCDTFTDAGDSDCSVHDHCILLTAATDPLLNLHAGTCGVPSTSGPFDVLRGRTEQLAFDSGSVDLGEVICVGGSVAWDRITNTSVNPNPRCGERAVFFLARNTGDTDFGHASAPGNEPRDVMNPDPVCP